MNTSPPLDWQSECNRYTVRIKRRVFKGMIHVAVSHAPVEVGTALVGSYSDDGYEATIMSLAPLTPDSQGSQFTFLRGVVGLADFFSRVFQRFRGQRHYVGEWHSHPDTSPTPSPTDDDDQTRIANDIDTECPEAILIIVGGDFSNEPQIGVYVYSRPRGRIDLHPIL